MYKPERKVKNKWKASLETDKKRMMKSLNAMKYIVNTVHHMQLITQESYMYSIHFFFSSLVCERDKADLLDSDDLSFEREALLRMRTCTQNLKTNIVSKMPDTYTLNSLLR